MTGTDPLQAGIYCRLSLARYGDTTKVDDQERICRKLAASLGWEVAEVYVDNSVSAWKRGRQAPRMEPDARRRRRRAASPRSSPTTVTGSSASPQDLGRLLLLAENKGIKLASPTGTYDLDNDKTDPLDPVHIRRVGIGQHLTAHEG